jgi:formylglycine-generating enzyme required for sulfatase activity
VARDSGRVRAKEKPVSKDGVYIGVDPRELPDLAVFKDIDAPWCPEMVLIPAGQFLMGSPPDEKGRYDFEGPQHRGGDRPPLRARAVCGGVRGV